MIKIAVATHKGGTGKTVTSINLAAGLARLKKFKPLLIDLDPQGHSSLGLGISADLNTQTISDVLKNTALDPNPLIKKYGSIGVLPSNISLSRVAESLYSAVKREEILSTVLSKIKGYDIAIMDCPPSLGTLTTNALNCADLIITPCEMGARAADGLVDLLEIIVLLKGDKFSNWAVLLTRFDNRKTITNSAVLKALSPHKGNTLKTKIFLNESLNQSQIAGKSIFDFEASSAGAKCYLQLAKEISEILNKLKNN